LVWCRFWHGDISETTFSINYCFDKLSIIQTCPGTTRFGAIKTVRFIQSPNLRKPGVPIETKKTRNAIRTRVHRISARDNFSRPVSLQNVFFVRAIVKLQNTKVLLNLYRQPYETSLWLMRRFRGEGGRDRERKRERERELSHGLSSLSLEPSVESHKRNSIKEWNTLEKKSENEIHSKLLNNPSGRVLKGTKPGPKKSCGCWARVRSLRQLLSPCPGLGPLSTPPERWLTKFESISLKASCMFHLLAKSLKLLFSIQSTL